MIVSMELIIKVFIDVWYDCLIFVVRVKMSCKFIFFGNVFLSLVIVFCIFFFIVIKVLFVLWIILKVIIGLLILFLIKFCLEFKVLFLLFFFNN